MDRETSANAGLDCISVTWGFGDEQVLRNLKPEYLVHKPEEVIQIVGKTVK